MEPTMSNAAPVSSSSATPPWAKFFVATMTPTRVMLKPARNGAAIVPTLWTAPLGAADIGGCPRAGVCSVALADPVSFGSRSPAAVADNYLAQLQLLKWLGRMPSHSRHRGRSHGAT